MTAAQRHTPTQTNMQADDGVSYENDVNTEISALWAVGAEWLVVTSGNGAPNVITATSDPTVVGAETAIGRPKAYWILPAGNNTTSVTLTKTDSGLGPYAIVDKDGNALVPNSLIGGRLTLLLFDGASFRLPISSGGSGTPATVNAVNNGRLTLSSGVFAPSSNILAATTLYWTPGLGNQIALYDGISSWINVASPEKSIPLTQTQTGTTSNGSKIITGLTDTSQLVKGMKAFGAGVGAGAVINTIDSGTQVTLSVNSTASASVSITFKCPANSVFDVFGVLTSGALKLQLWPWTNSTTRANPLTLQDGIDILQGTPTWRYLGTVATTAVDGQSEFSFGGSGSGGVAANLLVANCYNRKPARATVIDTAVNYNYASITTWRSADASNGMRITFVNGQAEDGISASYQDLVLYAAAGPSVAAYMGIGLDATNTPTPNGVQAATLDAAGTTIIAQYRGAPGAGLHFLQALELGSGNFHLLSDMSALAADLMM